MFQSISMENTFLQFFCFSHAIISIYSAAEFYA